MRKITGLQITAFLTLFSILIAAAFGTACLVLSPLPLGEFHAIVVILLTVILIVAYSGLTTRGLFAMSPWPVGDLPADSPQVFYYHVYLCFELFVLYPVTNSMLVPTPLTRALYRIWGAKIGENSYGQAQICEPVLVEIGEFCTLGMQSLFVPHEMEGVNVAFYPIKVGNRVTIGARAILMPGVVIEDDAIIAMNSVVRKNTHIGKNEIWGGIPAKFIKHRELQQPAYMETL